MPRETSKGYVGHYKDPQRHIGLDFLLGHRCDRLGSLHFWETFDADCQTARLDVSSTFDTSR